MWNGQDEVPTASMTRGNLKLELFSLLLDPHLSGFDDKNVSRVFPKGLEQLLCLHCLSILIHIIYKNL